MEEAAAVRRAALAAVDDVDPERLRERIAQRIEEGSMAPGALTLLSADAVDDSISRDGLAERAAGVQLIYEGLRLTRSLSHAEPWLGTAESDGWRIAEAAAVPAGNGKDSAAAAADLDILVADILVARGFYLLARTEAADAAVGVVRSFGRDQTVRRETDDPSLDGNLETDVFELAVVAGTTAAGASVPVQAGDFATDLAATDGDLPPAGVVLPDGVVERLHGLVGAEPTATEGARTSADH